MKFKLKYILFCLVAALVFKSHSQNTYTICKGDSIFIQDSYEYLPGEYQDTLVSKSKGELDSLIVSTLIVKESKDTSLSITVCDSLVWHSIKYSKSGIYIDTLETSIGCDSIVTLDLTIKCDEIEVDSLVQKDSLTTYNDIAKLDFEEENHKVVIVHHQDGKDFFYQDGVLIKEDSLGMLGQANNEDVFNSRDSLSFINKENKNATIFIYGFGKTDKVSKDWGNYYFEKESFEKAVYRFSKVKNKDVDVLRKLGKSYLSLNLLDSSEYYYGTIAEKTNNPVD